MQLLSCKIQHIFFRQNKMKKIQTVEMHKEIDIFSSDMTIL